MGKMKTFKNFKNAERIVIRISKPKEMLKKDLIPDGNSDLQGKMESIRNGKYQGNFKYINFLPPLNILKR